MQSQLALSSQLKVLVVMYATTERHHLVQNIQNFGNQVDILTSLPDILKKLNHTEYDMMFISITPNTDNSELTSFVRAGTAGKTPYLVGISSGLSELQKNIYQRFGGLHECISTENDANQISKIIRKVHQRKLHQKRKVIPMNHN